MSDPASKTTDVQESVCERCGMEFPEDEPGADLDEGMCPDCAEATT